MIIGIVCVDENWGIGKDNKLLFNIPEDMHYFTETTLNHIVCMGYNTLCSFPGSKPLKSRTNVVICPDYVEIDDCICVYNMDEMKRYIDSVKDEDIYIIGGAMFYKTMLPYYDKVLVTKVFANKEADTFFPNLDNEKQFTKSELSDIIYTENYAIQFLEYKRYENED